MKASKVIITITIGGLILAASAFVLANNSDTASPTTRSVGFYGGVDAGYADIATQDQAFVGLTSAEVRLLTAQPGAQTKHSGVTLGGHGGYQFNRYMSLEGGYSHFPKAGIKVNGQFLGAKHINVAYADARISYPVASKVSIFGKVGYSAIIQDVGGDDTQTNQTVKTHSKTDYSPLAGGGVEYRATQKLGLNLQYTAYVDPHAKGDSNGFPTTNTATLGLNYYF